jgi:hypothetical protein
MAAFSFAQLVMSEGDLDLFFEDSRISQVANPDANSTANPNPAMNIINRPGSPAIAPEWRLIK